MENKVLKRRGSDPRSGRRCIVRGKADIEGSDPRSGRRCIVRGKADIEGSDPRSGRRCIVRGKADIKGSNPRSGPGFVEKVARTIYTHAMLASGDTVIAAVSGGADSMAMLDVLVRLSEAYSLRIVVCHLNHNLRGAGSRGDMAFVRAAARSFGLGFACRTLRPGALGSAGASVQEGAREKRLEFLDSVSRRHGGARIALGHTLDDQAETVLMRFLKGGSLTGLSGMLPARGRHIRPLIEVARAEVEGYVRATGIRFVTDPSNLTTKYLRNDIRLRLLPYIRRRYNPNIARTLARSAAVLGRDDGYLAMEAEKAMDKAVLERMAAGIVLDRGVLVKLHPAIASRVFLKAAYSLAGEGEFGAAHVDSFIGLVKSGSPSARLRLPGKMTVQREYERIELTIGPPKAVRPFNAALKTPGTTRIKGAGVVLRTTVLDNPGTGPGALQGTGTGSAAGAPRGGRRASRVQVGAGPKGVFNARNAAFFDLDALPGPLIVRSFRPGDRITPLGMSGHKKLKEVFIEAKVPRRMRALVPVVCAGEDVLWAAPLRQSDLYKVRRGTKKVLKVEWIKGRGPA
jgi:tRNA(Ile)-lysidine synthase